MRIFETCEWRHINAKEKAALLSELDQMKCSVDKNLAMKNTVKNLTIAATVVGLASMLAVTMNKNK